MMIPMAGGNFYSPHDYIDAEVGKGILRSRSGARLVSFPQELTFALVDGLEDECGEAWPVVMYRCGEWWGGRQMDRIEKELGGFYKSPLKELPTAVVHASLSQWWGITGWGRLSLDITDVDAGFLVAEIADAPFAASFLASKRDAKGKTVDALPAGTLAGMFTSAAGVKVVCHEISCVARGDAACKFVLGADKALSDVPELVRKKTSAEEVIAKLRAASLGGHA